VEATEAEVLLNKAKTWGERQYATDLAKIKPNHRIRYEWAREQLRPLRPGFTVDCGCGIGYGTKVLSALDTSLYGLEACSDVVRLAEHYYGAKNIRFMQCDLHRVDEIAFEADAVVCFEVIEHLACPELFLLRLRRMNARPGTAVILSTPNTDVQPERLDANPFHFRHYTRAEILDLCAACGIAVEGVFGQDMAEISKKPGKFWIIKGKFDETEPDDKRIRMLAEELPTLLHDELIKRCRVIGQLKQKIAGRR
jgi:2-polyprenyl-3-methyl-5-hydroxy-6-metoxy-1,4-benzoquinol methylase